MNCMEVQERITEFIQNKLELPELTDFLFHIKNCGECREELEVYYTLLTAMQQLDEDKELSNHYKLELNRKISYWEDRIKRQKRQKLQRRFLFLFMLVSMAILFGIELGGKIVNVPEPVIQREPSFLFAYEGIPERFQAVNAFIAETDAEARQYVNNRKKLRHFVWSHQDFRRFFIMNEEEWVINEEYNNFGLFTNY